MKNRYSLFIGGLYLSSFCLIADTATEAIEGPMVAIPAGQFFMGSDRGLDDEKPVRRVTVPAFQMGKYEVTLKEFRRFANATKLGAPKNCYHSVLTYTQDLENWKTNKFAGNEFYPAQCITREMALDYARWLSEETGKRYRLPTEAEWEYAARAGSTTRYHFGDDASQACQYANVSEWYAKTMTDKKIPGANVRDVEQCNDREATLSVVGLYQSNQFGLFDMIGNSNEHVADCYQDSYAGAPTDGSATMTEDCSFGVVRGGTWHWTPWASSRRARASEDFIGVLEGFRLVLDTEQKSLPASKGTSWFSKGLESAQQDAKAAHEKQALIPAPITGLKVTTTTTAGIELVWSKNMDEVTSGYRVYRKNLMTNETLLIAEDVKGSQFLDKKPLRVNSEYFVIALNGNTESVKSLPISSGLVITHHLPKKVEAEAYSYAKSAEVGLSVVESENDRVILNTSSATYRTVTADQTQMVLKARVYHAGDDHQVKIWLGDRKLATTEMTGDRGWRTIDFKFLMPAGQHDMTIESDSDQFSVNWLDFTIDGIAKVH